MSSRPRTVVPRDVYCGVLVPTRSQIAAFLEAIPLEFGDASSELGRRNPGDVLATLARLEAAGEMTSVYWSRPYGSEHYAIGYTVSSTTEGGLIFGVGVMEDGAEQAKHWLLTKVAPEGVIRVVPEQPPPESHRELVSWGTLTGME